MRICIAPFTIASGSADKLSDKEKFSFEMAFKQINVSNMHMMNLYLCVLWVWFLRSGTDFIATHLFVVLFLVGATSSKNLRLYRFKSDRDEIWQKRFPCFHVNIDWQSWCHTIKMVAMTWFYAEKCCHLVSEQKASARWLCSSVHSIAQDLCREVDPQQLWDGCFAAFGPKLRNNLRAGLKQMDIGYEQFK